MHEQSCALDQGDELRLALLLVHAQIFHIESGDPVLAEAVDDGRGGRFVGDVDVDLGRVDDDGSPAEAVEFVRERVRGCGGEDGDDLELVGGGFVDDLRGAGHLGEHRILWGASGDGRVEEVEEFDDSRRSGVDDLGLAQHGELSRGLPQRGPGAFPHGFDDLEQVGPVVSAFAGFDGHGVEDGEHGAVDGPGDGGACPIGGGLEGGRHGVGGGDGDSGQGVGDSLEGDGEDESRVAAGTASGPGCECGDDVREGDGPGELFDGEVGGTQSVVHVRAGVAVGDGEDVEFVDLGAFLAQPVDRASGPACGQTTVETDGVAHVTSRNG